MPTEKRRTTYHLDPVLVEASLDDHVVLDTLLRSQLIASTNEPIDSIRPTITRGSRERFLKQEYPEPSSQDSFLH